MLQRHRHSQKHLRPAADAAVLPPAAPVAQARPGAGCSLLLPAIARSVKPNWEFNPSTDRLVAMAHLLADAGLMRSLQGSLQQSIEAALTTLASDCRPGEGMAPFSLCATDDVSDFQIHWDSYAKENKINKRRLWSGAVPWQDHTVGEFGAGTHPSNSRLGAFLISNDCDGIYDCTIGPALTALEAWPRLGQTVLTILEKGLQQTTRVLSPGTGIAWASFQYWASEDDETSYLMEQLEEVRDEAQIEHRARNPKAPPLTDEEIINDRLNIFRRRDYERDIPPKWHRDRKPLKSLPPSLSSPTHVGDAKLKDIFWMEEHWPEIWQACETIRALTPRCGDSDNRYCEEMLWEAVPFMLRMHDNDCLPRILDDVWQHHYESGEGNLDVNSIFLWYDAPSLAKAAGRVRRFLILVKACEDLIALLDFKSGVPCQTPIGCAGRIPIRVRA